MSLENTICAVATAPGTGAVAIIRLSGRKSFEITDKIFFNKKGKKISEQKPYSIHFGEIKENVTVIDEVLVSVFRSPHSYTGEDSVEISCHGSLFIQQKILNILLKNGASLAQAGEFTKRAFLNGKMDLSQAEAVADLISSSSAASHRVAIQQMRGGFSNDLKDLRSRLVKFISLVELELDFSEEDVEFADRIELGNLIEEIKIHISKLSDSFELGNVIKNGIPVAIVGEPNVGKSTLLNVLLNEDKAIVSEIAGTTRDAIEDVISVKGILFRFIDTAGIRHTEDKIESLGIERTMSKIDKAEIVLLLIDAQDKNAREKIEQIRNRAGEKKIIVVVNKTDKNKFQINNLPGNNLKIVEISAKYRTNIDILNDALIEAVNFSNVKENDIIITNARHFEVLQKALISSERVISGLLQNISGDFLAQDIREILQSIGEITGTVTSDEILGNIFVNFCIGK
jgi:tRNA modification GTPase